MDDNSANSLRLTRSFAGPARACMGNLDPARPHPLLVRLVSRFPRP